MMKENGIETSRLKIYYFLTLNDLLFTDPSNTIKQVRHLIDLFEFLIAIRNNKTCNKGKCNEHENCIV